jgi:hypothetical protein
MSFNNLYTLRIKPVINFSNNFTNNLTDSKEIIKVKTEDNYYIDIFPNIIIKTYHIIVLNCNEIFLPIISGDQFMGISFEMINTTNRILKINSQNSQKIYSNLYLPKNGDTSIQLNKNSLYVFYVIKKEDLFSWIII